MRSLKVVVFDLDGVLVPFRSSWEFLHRYFGVDDEGIRNENVELFYSGLISYYEWMRRDLTLLTSRGCITRDDVLKAFRAVELVPGGRELCSYLISRGFELAIVSGGIDLLALEVGYTLGIKRVYANKLLFNEYGCLLPYGVEVVNPLKKEVVLSKMSSELGVPLSEFMYVGDTLWDVSAFKAVGYPVIYNCRECEDVLDECGKEYLVINELLEIIPFVEGLVLESSSKSVID
ncbi:MAG: HAD-IB family phosphatase [Sulfolobales archaeon]|nr:HAD-IB family phosphatase [Sulfolobales archaeon]